MLDVWEVGESGIDDLRTSNRPHSSRPKRSPGAASWLWPTFDLGVQDWPNIGFPIKTVILGVYLVGKPWANHGQTHAHCPQKGEVCTSMEPWDYQVAVGDEGI